MNHDKSDKYGFFIFFVSCCNYSVKAKETAQTKLMTGFPQIVYLKKMSAQNEN